MGYRRYDPDFKREAVRMVAKEVLGVREVERSLGITYGVLKGWVQKHRDHQDAAFAAADCSWFAGGGGGVEAAAQGE
jgi:transposase